MTTVTLPTVPPPPPSLDGAGRRLPLPGRYTVAPGRSLTELTAWCGPLPVLRRRVTLGEASLTVLEDAENPSFRYEFDDHRLCAVLTSEQVDEVHGRLQLTGELDLGGTAFPVLMRLRVIERADDRLLVVGHARLPYRLLRRATGFRLPWHRPATRLRLLVAAEFA
ncbi:hypothetical protein ACSNOJ_32260 [Streptomyces sp. URMC 128]|uniref:hypothetical protein n=1 Tax=Streptomyces sp. URMC 128 TaxID=3423404 RepID=UPI003F1D1A1E